MNSALRLLVLLAAFAGILAPRPSIAAVDQTGYLPLSDGVLLRYSLDLPQGDGPFPVLLNYSMYEAGTTPNFSTQVKLAARMVSLGYALLGVSMRGTGCSAGDWTFNLESWGRDGYDVVEWAARQPWSDGNIGMIGVSGPAVTQISTAAFRPPHLKAIAPASITLEQWRDVVRPGGILSHFIAAGWAGILTAEQSKAVTNGAVSQNDPACVRHMDGRAQRGTTGNIYRLLTTAATERYDERRLFGGTLAEQASRIDVPTLVWQPWQDQQLLSGASNEFSRFDQAKTWFVGSSGDHSTPVCDRCSVVFERFYERFLGGEDNGFESTPRVQFWMDVAGQPGPRASAPTVREPGWIVSGDAWPLQTISRRYLLGADGTLDGTKRGTQAYVYPTAAPTLPWPEHKLGWSQPVVPAGSLAYTTPVLGEDLVVAGPASLDVWMSTTAADTDVQATITEVRPDGQELYVQRGWLRASDRAIDESRSTEVRPWHVFTADALKPMQPGRAELLRVEILPFAHAFRAGSSLRVWIDTPSLTGLWTFDHLKDASVNTVHHTKKRPSSLVLPILPGIEAETGLPACDSLLAQPCRRDPLAG